MAIYGQGVEGCSTFAWGQTGSECEQGGLRSVLGSGEAVPTDQGCEIPKRGAQVTSACDPQC